jgi:hypothetical protein
MTTAEVIDCIAEAHPDVLFAEGYDEAILGVVEGCARETVVCYDYQKCIELLMEDSDMDEEAAIEWMEFNVVGAYVGERTPMFLRRVK